MLSVGVLLSFRRIMLSKSGMTVLRTKLKNKLKLIFFVAIRSRLRSVSYMFYQIRFKFAFITGNDLGGIQIRAEPTGRVALCLHSRSCSTAFYKLTSFKIPITV